MRWNLLTTQDDKYLKYRISVYEEYATIEGDLTAEILILLVRLSKKEGFTHLTHDESKTCFKLVRKYA